MVFQKQMVDSCKVTKYCRWMMRIWDEQLKIMQQQFWRFILSLFNSYHITGCHQDSVMSMRQFIKVYIFDFIPSLWYASLICWKIYFSLIYCIYNPYMICFKTWFSIEITTTLIPLTSLLIEKTKYCFIFIDTHGKSGADHWPIKSKFSIIITSQF